MALRSARIEIALRVLSACNSGQRPDGQDLAELKRHAGSDEVEMPIDELACSVIKRQMQRARHAISAKINRAS